MSTLFSRSPDEDSVCADVAAKMSTASHIVRYALDLVFTGKLTRSMFYSTSTLREIVSVVVPDSGMILMIR
jgi:hypothetical protein